MHFGPCKSKEQPRIACYRTVTCKKRSLWMMHLLCCSTPPPRAGWHCWWPSVPSAPLANWTTCVRVLPCHGRHWRSQGSTCLRRDRAADCWGKQREADSSWALRQLSVSLAVVTLERGRLLEGKLIFCRSHLWNCGLWSKSSCKKCKTVELKASTVVCVVKTQSVRKDTDKFLP